MSNTTIVPFVKWVGGKRQIQEVIKSMLPKSFNPLTTRYYEPFIGGGALLFYLQPKNVVINDFNNQLTNVYSTLKSSEWSKVTEYLLLFEYLHDGDKDNYIFDKVKRIDQNEDERYAELWDSNNFRAARFIYLNKSCFNGLYRVNSKNHFNVPPDKGKTKVTTFVKENIVGIHNYLNESNINILSGDFEKALESVNKGDFVYLDPPYDYEVGINGFDSYNKSGFGVEGQKRLANVCKRINDKGAFFILSNHNTKLIQDLYKDFNIKVIDVQRNVSSKKETRGKIEEVLVYNYEL